MVRSFQNPLSSLSLSSFHFISFFSLFLGGAVVMQAPLSLSLSLCYGTPHIHNIHIFVFLLSAAIRQSEFNSIQKSKSPTPQFKLQTKPIPKSPSHASNHAPYVHSYVILSLSPFSLLITLSVSTSSLSTPIIISFFYNCFI